MRRFRFERAAWWLAGAGVALVGVGAVLVKAARTPALAPPARLVYQTARPLALVPGTTYYARASLSFLERIFATADVVQNHLAALGFSNIIASTNSASLPASWPASDRDGDLFVEATYTGPAKMMAVPSQVVAIWTV